MQRLVDLAGRLYGAVYADSMLRRIEQVTIFGAAVAFLVHLAIIAVVKKSAGELDLGWFSSSYLAALYTPFSFLLFYEVLLLVRALPSSFSRSVAVQFEVVALIVLRRVFKDIAHLDGSGEVLLSNAVVWEIAADMVGALALFGLVHRFRQGIAPQRNVAEATLSRFIAFKQLLSLVLGLVVLSLSVLAFHRWAMDMLYAMFHGAGHLLDVNAIFYVDFFGLLVLVDVLLLLISFGYTRRTEHVFRNAGYISSTVLVLLSFTAPRLHSIVLMVFAIGFSVVLQALVGWVEARPHD